MTLATHGKSKFQPLLLLAKVIVYRHDYKLGVKMRARVLTTIPDSTSRKFLLVGTLHKESLDGDKRRPHAAIFLDFATLSQKQCTESQFEKWQVRTAKDECVMGHKVWMCCFSGRRSVV